MNLAQLKGWRVFHLTAVMIRDGQPAVDLLIDLEEYLTPVSVRKPLKEMGEQALSLLEAVFKREDITSDNLVLKPVLNRRKNG